MTKNIKQVDLSQNNNFVIRIKNSSIRNQIYEDKEKKTNHGISILTTTTPKTILLTKGKYISDLDTGQSKLLRMTFQSSFMNLI